MRHKFSQMKFGKPYNSYILPRSKRKLNRWALIILTLSALIYVLVATAAAVAPAVERVSKKLLEVNAAKIINSAISKTLDGSITYESLTDISYSSDGSVNSINARTGELNRLKSDITMQILSSIEQMGAKGFSVPLGNLTDIFLFSGVGPDIPFQIVPYGAATVDFRNSFTSAGVNQTRHEIYIDITADLHALSSVSNVRATVSTSVMAAQTVIVGKIPQFFAN